MNFFIKKYILIIVIATILSSICTASINENQKNGLLLYNTNILSKITRDLNLLGLINTSVGYDKEGRVVIWINVLSGLSDKKIKELNIKKPFYGYYHAYISKKIFENIPEIDSIWLYFDVKIYNYFTYISRDTFNNRGLAELPIDEKSFYENIDKPLESLVDIFWNPENLGDEIMADTSQVSRNFKKLFKGRLKSFKVGGASSESVYIYANINGLPDGRIRFKL